MTAIIVRDVEGVDHALEAIDGHSVLETMLDAGLPVKATCFGCCNCSTCHVVVDADWVDKIAPAEEQEVDVLEQVANPTPASRLSCQILVDPSLEGLKVTLTEDTVP